MKKFEFVLYINRNIICQRYFSVRNYNPEVTKSLDIVECINDCVYVIQKDMKKKSKEYLWKHYNPWKVQQQDEINNKNIFENEDVFDFDIKVDGRAIATKRFTGNVYPQRVRYSVDIRDIIPTIINTIQETLSQENFDVEYSGIEL
jgi:hypothetical protein